MAPNPRLLLATVATIVALGSASLAYASLPSTKRQNHLGPSTSELLADLLEKASETEALADQRAASRAPSSLERALHQAFSRVRVKSRVRGSRAQSELCQGFSIKLSEVAAGGYVGSWSRTAEGVHVGPNQYQFALNSPYSFSDPTGEVAETVWDAASLGLGLTSLYHNVRSGNYGGAVLDAAGIVIDAAATATPFVPGGAGAALKASRSAGVLGKAVLVDQTLNVGQGVIQARDAAKEGDYGWAAFYGGMSALGVRGMDASPFEFRARAGVAPSGLGGLGIVPKRGVSESPVLSTQRELSQLVNRQGAVVDRWLRTSQTRWARLYRAVQRTSPNFAKGIRGRFLDRRMNTIFQERFGDLRGVRIDQTIPGSGNALRPDLFLPDLGGKSVIFDVGGPSKVRDLRKYKRMADFLLPLIPRQWF